MKNSLTSTGKIIVLSALALIWLAAPMARSEGTPTQSDTQSDQATTQAATSSKAEVPAFMGDKLTTESIERHLGEPGVVRLTWKTQSEDGTFGYNVMRRKSEKGDVERINEKPILGAGFSSTENFYEYFDKTVKVGETYYYSLQEIRLSGQTNDFSPVIGRRVCYLNLEAKGKAGKDAGLKDKSAAKAKAAQGDDCSTRSASRRLCSSCAKCPAAKKSKTCCKDCPMAKDQKTSCTAQSCPCVKKQSAGKH